MPTTAGSTARGLPYPGDTGSAPDGPAAFKALADSIETMMNSDLVLGAGLDVPDGLRVSGAFVPTSGSGVEIGYTGGIGFVQSQQRGPNASKPMVVGGSEVRVNAGGVQVATATSTGVDFPLGFTGKRLDSPYFRAYRSTAASYASGATVIFNTETDPNGWYDPTTGIFLPTVAGMYRVSWKVSAGTLTADNYLLTYVDHPGGGGIAVSYGEPIFQRGAAVGVSSRGSDLMPFNGTTDAIEVVISHNQGGSLSITGASASTHFEAERIGA